MPYHSRLRKFALMLLVFSGFSAHAQSSFPLKPVTIVVLSAPGGSPDILARTIAPALSARLNQPIQIENKAGSAGNIAAEIVARAVPDGHTLFLANDQLSVNQTLFTNLPFHAINSFAPVVQLISSPQVLVVNADLSFKNLPEFIAAAKASPGKLSVASPAIGTAGQLGVLLLQSQAQIKLNPVVYKSAQPGLTDLLGKHVDAMVVTAAPALPFIREGKLRAIALSSPARSQVLSDVPTFAEQGMPRYSFDAWQGFVVPAKTPRDVVDRLNREINAVLKQPDIHAALIKQAFVPKGGSSEEFAYLVRDSISSWADIIRSNGIRVE
jgi:tripartite-type tricarboxylate transporter receptor subunit TctC